MKPGITLSRRFINFHVAEGQSVTKEVEILAHLDAPLTLTPQPFNLDGKMTYRLEEIEKGRKYRILLRNIPGPEGDYRGSLRLKTNYPMKPELTVWIWGHVRKHDEESGR